MNTPLPGTLDAWLELLESRHPRSMELGLERVREVAGRMALPSPARTVITVGGTNGKGSTVAFLQAITRAEGMRVGCYTSPHLVRYNERVHIDGEEVTDDQLIAAFAAVEAARSATPLTFFETGTLAALWLFARADLDLAVLEVGLGGRLDAVNIIDADVAVITTVDLDHQDWLGADVETIGAEKAGIARAGKPLVLGDDDPPASVLRHAYAIGAPSWRIGCDFFAEIDAERANGEWRYREPGFVLQLPAPALAAPVQRRNAALAIAALRAAGIQLREQSVREGVVNAHIEGRLAHRVVNGVDVWLDIGHNPQAARALAQWLDAQPVQPSRAVLAALADKDAAGVVQALDARITHWHLAGLEGVRGQPAQALAATLHVPTARHSLHRQVADALDAALAAARPGERVLVLGSFHTVAQALARLDQLQARL